MSFVSHSYCIEKNIYLTDSIEKCLETLDRRDYDEFLAALKPEMENAKKIITGKQIASVSPVRLATNHLATLT